MDTASVIFSHCPVASPTPKVRMQHAVDGRLVYRVPIILQPIRDALA